LKKHPSKNAYSARVKVKWAGYEGTSDEFSDEPLQNMLEDVPDMAWPFLKSKLDLEVRDLVQHELAGEVYFE